MKLNEICDGKIDCKYGDDEEFCNKSRIDCPKNCDCSPKYTINCKSELLQKEIILNDLDHKSLTMINIKTYFLSVKDYKSITYLKILNTKMEINYIIKKFPNLFHLDSLGNNLNKLNIQLNMNKLALNYLSITFNKILKIDKNTTLKYFPLLMYLNFTYSNLKYLPENLFKNLNHLKLLNMAFTNIKSIHKYSFIFFNNLTILNISKTEFPNDYITYDLLRNMSKLSYIYSSIFKFCCLAKSVYKQQLIDCEPSESLIHSCNDLLPSNFLKILVLLFGIIGIFGNILSLHFHVKNNRNGSKLFYLTLSFADFCTGFYIFIISMSDFYFRGNYILHDFQWRNSVFCSIIGCFSSFSVIVSSISIALVTVERHFYISNPFKKFLTPNIKQIICLALILLGLILSLLPLLIYQVSCSISFLLNCNFLFYLQISRTIIQVHLFVTLYTSEVKK